MTPLSLWLEARLPRAAVPWVITAIYALTLFAILVLISIPNDDMIYLDINATQ